MSILPASGMGDESTGFYPFKIGQSIRITENGYLNMSTNGFANAPTLDTKGTISFWIKLQNNDSRNYVFQNYQANNNNGLMDIRVGGSDSNDGMHIGQYGRTPYTASTTGPKQRDFTNFYNIVVSFDSTSATSSDRNIQIHINGTQVTTGSFNGTAAIGQNDKFPLTAQGSANGGFTIGRHATAGYYTDCILAEINLIDGQRLAPSYFGETKNGVWIPKAYTGTYGNNGCRFTFASSDFNTSGGSVSDPNGSSVDLFNNGISDASGNGNHLNLNSVNTHDILLDSPTNNFCVFNELEVAHTNELTLSEGNLGAVPSATSAWNTRVGNFNFSSGKWYAEFSRVTDVTGAFFGVLQTGSTDGLYIGYGSQGYGYYLENGSVQNNASVVTNGSLGVTGTKFDVIGVALNLDDNELRFYKNGSVLGSNPISITDASYAFGASATQSGNLVIANFGQDSSFAGYITSGSDSATDENGQGDFFDAPPSGFLAMCSANIPDVAISADQSTQADDHFGTAIWSGNATARDISLGFQADWVWTKMRSHDNAHYAFDSVRGDNAGLYPNLSQQEGTTSGRVSFGNTDGFTLGTDAQVNGSGYTFVGWSWKAGGEPTADNSAGAGNTPTSNSVKIDGSNLGSALAGTIPATRLSANTTAGFSIVTYTGTGTQSDTVAHGLGVKPAWYFTKSRSEAQNWHVYHQKLDASAPENYIITLNASNARSSSSANFWNSTAPTTSVVSVGDDNSSNKNNVTYVMYCFAEILGFSKFGTYNGNSSTDGTFVYTGFRPAMIIFKATHSDSWVIADNKRDPHNQVNGQLFPDLSNPESTSNAICDFLSNGFKLRRNAGSINQNTYIYMAFAEQTFKFSNAR